MESYVEGEEFIAIHDPLPPGEYENCTFKDCEFTNLSSHAFIDCSFSQCNLTNANVTGTTFNEVQFTNCKIIGVRFDVANEFIFSVQFESCNLHLCSFYKRNLQGSKFNSCDLTEADFAESDCTSTVFNQSDLRHAIFEGSTLVKTDFSTVENLSLDPEKNFFQKCIFSPQSALGLLHKYDLEIRF